MNPLPRPEDAAAGENGTTKPGRIHPGVGVGALVTRGTDLLMILRAGAHGAGTWSVPGGWIEMWEDPFDAAEREVAEETGLKVNALAAAGWTDSPHRDEGVHAVTLWIKCEYLDGEPTVVEPDKCPEVRWVPADEVGSLPLFKPLDTAWPTLTGLRTAGGNDG